MSEKKRRNLNDTVESASSDNNKSKRTGGNISGDGAKDVQRKRRGGIKGTTSSSVSNRKKVKGSVDIMDSIALADNTRDIAGAIALADNNRDIGPVASADRHYSTIEEQIHNVEEEIKRVQSDIEKVEKKIEESEGTEKQYFMDKEKQIRDEKIFCCKSNSL